MSDRYRPYPEYLYLDEQVAQLYAEEFEDSTLVLVLGPMGQTDEIPLGQVLAFAAGAYDSFDILSVNLSSIEGEGVLGEP